MKVSMNGLINYIIEAPYALDAKLHYQLLKLFLEATLIVNKMGYRIKEEEHVYWFESSRIC